MNCSAQQRLALWERFVQTVVYELGDHCDAYQLMNEPNNPIYSIFELAEAGRAIQLGALEIRKAKPRPTVINISTDLWKWREYLFDLLRLSGDFVDIVGLDHYPGTWTLGAEIRWTGILETAHLVASASPDSVWFNRRLAVMETGYSTNAPLRDETRQAQYFTGIARFLGDLKAIHPDAKDVLLGIYELADGDGSAFLDPESHFGILTNDLRPKLAVQAVKDLIANHLMEK